MPWNILKRFLIFFCCWKHRVFLSDFHCDQQIELPEEKLTKVKGSLCDASPGIFDSHTLILLRLQPITVQVFLPQHWFPWHFLLVSLYSGKQWLPVSICFSLQSCVQWFVLCPPFSYGSKKSLNFYLLLGYSGNFPSSLHIELETRSL